MKSLVIEKIKKSICLMDEFTNGEYDYLELRDWFWIKDLEKRQLQFDDNSGIFNISLLISKNRDRKRKLCKFEPSMTELRQMRHHGLCLERNYEDDSLDGIINNACRIWKKDMEIKLSTQICLRAQTSWNRLDYGCKWLGGGDWEERTLYGETTDFYIDSIILREQYKSVTQEAREILNELSSLYGENSEYINTVMNAFVYKEQRVVHKVFGDGYICEVKKDKMKVKFNNNYKLFKWPDSILQGYLKLSDQKQNPILQNAIDKWNENQGLSKKIKVFKYVQENSLSCFNALINYKKELDYDV